MKDRFTSIAASVRYIVDKMPKGTEFHGNDLKKEVVKLYPAARYCYVDTVLRKMRECRNGRVKCISVARSLYRKVA